MSEQNRLVCYSKNVPYGTILRCLPPTKSLGPSQSLELLEPNPIIFTNGIKRIQEYIREGDVYQVNLSRKYIVKHSCENLDQLRDLAQEIYQRLKLSNPAPYASLSESDDYIIISSSPECFLRIEKLTSGEFQLSTMPIKGTANFGDEPCLRSSKNQAEHIMIVDLERNDLSRICKPNSVQVEELMQAHRFNNLEHLISTVTGILREDLAPNGQPDLTAIFNAMFPSGSITGAPKIRAMEIIEELEPCSRGPYTGVLGYYDSSRNFGEYSILIRTIVIDKRNTEISFHVGGGITALSDPLEELEETRLKAAKLIEAIQC